MTTHQIKPSLCLWNSPTIKAENTKHSPSSILCSGCLGIWPSSTNQTWWYGYLPGRRWYKGETRECSLVAKPVATTSISLLTTDRNPAAGGLGSGNSGCVFFTWPPLPGCIHLHRVFQSSEHLWTIQDAFTKFLFCRLQQRTLINKFAS